MSAINLGPNGAPVQVSPIVPQPPPSTLLQPPAAQPGTAIPALESQASSNTQGNSSLSTGPRTGGDNSGPPASGGRGQRVDIRA
jgi:hypothetical protein